MVSERRTKREFAQEVCQLAQELYPDAEKIRLVCDNLSTHSPAAFYEILAPEQARRLSRRVEFIYTPVDGSWLNMVEVEICRVGQTVSEGKAAWQHCEELRSEAEAWCWERNRLSASVDWRFTTSDARIKLRKLYPSIEL